MISRQGMRSPSRRQFLTGATALTLAGLVNRAWGQQPLSAMWFDWGPWNAAGEAIFASGSVPVTLRKTVFGDMDRLTRSLPDQPDPFDLVMVDGPSIPTYVAAGLLEPVDDAFTDDIADFLPSPRRAATIGGKFYGPAMDESSQALWYNKAVLDRYNIVPPSTLETAWTWDQAREIFIEVQAKERERLKSDRFWALVIGQDGTLGGGVYTGQNLSRSAGEAGSPTYKAIGDDGITVAGYLDTPEAMDAYRFIQNLYNKDGLVPLSEGPDFFQNEQCAFWLAAVSRRRAFMQANPNLVAGVTPHPYFKTPVVHTGSFHVAVSAYSRRKDDAKRALAHLASADGIEAMAKAAGDFPSRQSLIPRFTELMQAPLDIFAKTVEQWGHPRPLTPGFAEYGVAVDRMLKEIASGADVSSTVSTTVADLQRRLRRYAGFKETLGK
ncbi:extracellular solute-binding protein [Rhizobium etli]|uniref:extracellular solute-binding protein n=1 Tax=Rhizobium etli TaxID=29449 RepID=UPI0003839819|nr:extracellular solute-binding protein [Rhizobium etli]AGS25224.1 sugar ABC transporter substrate-binding protein [Rhizobium etli bv. mimosae str. Mim1]